MQSNLAIAEELLRIGAYLEPETPTCPNDQCSSYGKSASETVTYARFGVNAHGTPRYRCGSCRKVFAFGGKSTKRQRRTHVNRDVFEHLVNSVPLRRIVKLLQISPDTLYAKLDFIHRQRRLFAGARERTLLDRTDLRKRYISTDRQKFVVNWSSRKDRRNTLLLSIASADLMTGYVLAANLNYDSRLQYDEVAKDAVRYGDHKLTKPFRRYARVWLPDEFEAAAQAAPSELPGKPSELAEAGARLDIEAGDGAKRSARTPVRGAQLHETSVMNAHIQLVTRLLQRAPKLRFYLDQESGLRAAFMAAVPERIKNRTADAFYVSVAKEQTVDAKRKLVQRALRRIKEFKADHPGLTDKEAQTLLMRQEMLRAIPLGQFKDPWANHPVSDMREPEKKVCWLTDIDQPAEDVVERKNQRNHAARLYLQASLSAVDRFFMQIRRGITMAERGVISASSDRRLWFGKNAYDPDHLARLLEIYRVYFNYCAVGEDKKTPAMRLGLARGPVASEDILYFTPRRLTSGCLERRIKIREPDLST
ncbi:MAG: transposase [Noviherbaspirillum sp.]